MRFESKSNGLGLPSKSLPFALLMYGCAAVIGCALELAAESILPLWMVVKPRATTVGSAFRDTPLEPLTQWLIFMLLYVPDVLLLFLAGFLAGLFVRRRCLVWLSTCVLFYAAFVVFRGGGPWWYALRALLWGASRDTVFYGSMAVIILSSPYLGARIGVWLRPPPQKPGECKKCGYLLFGLTSCVCPECGLPFSEEHAKLGDAIDTPGGTPCQIVYKFSIVFRLVALGVFVLSYYAWDWMPFRIWMRDALAALLNQIGYPSFLSVHEGSPSILLGERLYYYTKDCTHWDLVAVVVPFVWVWRTSVWANIVRILIATFVILAGNLVRSVAALYYNAMGVDWFFSHDLPNYVMWCAIAAVVLFVLRRDMRVAQAAGVGGRDPAHAGRLHLLWQRFGTERYLRQRGPGSVQL